MRRHHTHPDQLPCLSRGPSPQPGGRIRIRSTDATATGELHRVPHLFGSNKCAVSAPLADGAAVAAFVRDHVDRPAVELEPRRLYTAREIEALTGVKTATIRADRTRGRWPEPDDDSERAHRWYGATVTRALSGRRGYRRAEG